MLESVLACRWCVGASAGDGADATDNARRANWPACSTGWHGACTADAACTAFACWTHDITGDDATPGWTTNTTKSYDTECTPHCVSVPSLKPQRTTCTGRTAPYAIPDSWHGWLRNGGQSSSPSACSRCDYDALNTDCRFVLVWNKPHMCIGKQ